MNSIVHCVVHTYPVISEHVRRDDITGVLHYSIKNRRFQASAGEPYDVVPIKKKSSHFYYVHGQMIRMSNLSN